MELQNFFPLGLQILGHKIVDSKYVCFGKDFEDLKFYPKIFRRMFLVNNPFTIGDETSYNIITRNNKYVLKQLQSYTYSKNIEFNTLEELHQYIVDLVNKGYFHLSKMIPKQDMG